MHERNKKKGTWCVVSVENSKVKARIAHVGRGKFRIVEDQSSKHTDKEIDASDAFHCRE
ncbi:MAG: hypothetical protein ACREBU_05850 [Nitrososphaera sp.]